MYSAQLDSTQILLELVAMIHAVPLLDLVGSTQHQTWMVLVKIVQLYITSHQQQRMLLVMIKGVQRARLLII